MRLRANGVLIALQALVQMRNNSVLPFHEVARDDVLARLTRQFEVECQIVHAADVQSEVFIGFD